MKSAAPSRRDRLRQILADLRMPGALEALDVILQGVDGGALTAPEAIEQLLSAQIQLRNNRRLQAAMRSIRLPAVKQLRDFDFTFQPSLGREQIESLHELADAEPALQAWEHAYNHHRFSMALGGLTPAENLHAKLAAEGPTDLVGPDHLSGPSLPIQRRSHS